MAPTDTAVVFERLVILGEVFRTPLSPAVQVAYFEALADLPLEAVLSAMNAAIRVCTFMPKPAELRALIAGDVEGATERAWLELKRAAFDVGAYQSPTLPAPLAATILAIFGSWEAACTANLSAEMGVARRKEFGRVYPLFAGLQGWRRLEGICDRDNRVRGFLDGDPIGELEAASQELEPRRLLLPVTAPRVEDEALRRQREEIRDALRAERRQHVQAALEAHQPRSVDWSAFDHASKENP